MFNNTSAAFNKSKNKRQTCSSSFKNLDQGLYKFSINKNFLWLLLD